jgi:predicted O-methyltransferase YrrM
MSNPALSPQQPATENLSQLLETARHLLNNQRLVEAAYAFRAVLAEQPDCVEALMQLGQLFFEFNELPASLGCLEQVAKLSPALPGLNTLTAAVLRKMGRLEESALGSKRENHDRPTDAAAHDDSSGVNVRASQNQPREAGGIPSGDYYSPMPAREEVIARLKLPAPIGPPADVDLHCEAQRALLGQYAAYYGDIHFHEEKNSQHRYHYHQDWFAHADAIFLFCFLRHFRPRRIIEIGSGYSSAVMLDTLEQFPYGPVDVTFIEPSPDRLLGTLRPRDKAAVTILARKVQEVDLNVFDSLTTGDLLFIDSSHVFKYGSDLQRIFYEILPRLPVGVFVHFHDIFYGFEYPADWLANGCICNENYFLRAFLAYNESWRIVFFNSYAGLEFKDILAEKMPLCLKDIGGSIYLKRIK